MRKRQGRTTGELETWGALERDYKNGKLSLETNLTHSSIPSLYIYRGERQVFSFLLSNAYINWHIQLFCDDTNKK